MPCYDPRSSNHSSGCGYTSGVSEGEIREIVNQQLGKLSPDLPPLLSENARLSADNANLKRALTNAKESAEMLEQRNHQLARMLCSLMTHFASNEPFALKDIEGLEAWWAEHQIFDKERRAAGEN